MTNQTTSPIDALRTFGITAAEDETFVIADDSALREVCNAFDDATGALPAGHDWKLFAMKADDDHWHCSVGQAVESWPYPSIVQAA